MLSISQATVSAIGCVSRLREVAEYANQSLEPHKSNAFGDVKRTYAVLAQWVLATKKLKWAKTAPKFPEF